VALIKYTNLGDRFSVFLEKLQNGLVKKRRSETAFLSKRKFVDRAFRWPFVLPFCFPMLRGIFHPFASPFDFPPLSGVFLSVAAQKYAMQV